MVAAVGLFIGEDEASVRLVALSRLPEVEAGDGPVDGRKAMDASVSSVRRNPGMSDPVSTFEEGG